MRRGLTPRERKKELEVGGGVPLRRGRFFFGSIGSGEDSLWNSEKGS